VYSLLTTIILVSLLTWSPVAWAEGSDVVRHADAIGVGTAWALLPAGLAIALALLTKRVVVALVAGTLCATLLLEGLNPIKGAWAVLNPYVYEAVVNVDHLLLTAFTLLVAATLGVLTASGCTRALVTVAERRATDPRSGQLATWAAGLALFFDDYANCLVVGSTMRPLTDRLKISRAKLAYIVDSTAAPIASLAIISTWVGFEVSLIDEGLKSVGSPSGGYEVFVAGLPFRAYSIFTIVFVALIAWTRRDYGPMLEAERRAANGPDVEATAPSANIDDKHGLRLAVAVIAIAVLVFGTFGGLIYSGMTALGADASGASLRDILGAAAAYYVLFYCSIAALIVSQVLSATLGLAPPKEALNGAWESTKTMSIAVGVLVLAWSLGASIDALDAASYIQGTLGSWLPPALLPVCVFIAAAACAFATGTSFGTMTIMLPVVVPLAVELGHGGPIMLAAIAAVLDGAIWGDHTSPISDTTVLSSLATECDVVEHVRTQLPYALTTGLIAVLFGYVLAGSGVSPWIGLPLGIVACVAAVRFAGKPVEVETHAA